MVFHKPYIPNHLERALEGEKRKSRFWEHLLQLHLIDIRTDWYPPMAV